MARALAAAASFAVAAAAASAHSRWSASGQLSAPAAPGLFGVLSGAQLARINPADGSAAPVGAGLPAYEFVGQNLAAVDRSRGVYYVLGYNSSRNATNLVGVDMATGAVVSDVPTPFVLPGFFASGEAFLAFSDARGRAVLAGQTAVGAPEYTFVLMDPATGAWSVVARLNASAYGPVGYAPSVLLPARDEFVALYAVNPGASEVLSLIAVGLADGAVRVWDADCGDAVVLDVDAATGDVYGIGQDRAHAFERALFRFAPDGSTCARVGADIGAFETLVVGEGAIDSAARVFYWTSMPANATRPPFPPVDLVGTSLDDAATVSAHPYAGDGDPAQLRFLNA